MYFYVFQGIVALLRFKKILDQAKKLTIFIYSHHKTLDMMRKFTKKRDIVRPGVTRLAGDLEMQMEVTQVELPKYKKKWTDLVRNLR